ncbi:hypothetical protein PSTT_03830 [Puccinia striiformis]|uniref:Secreted protein n=1 Tax=Puccinia striiformis TaxID=27350 RepID=A0A2S4VV53_9BASI|nr:hypothetical protein PSTT_03830 [Puccinia striiformis]
MKATTTAVFVALSLSAVTATNHTACYNYFLKKDGCVFSAAAADQRCPAPVKEHSAPVKAFHAKHKATQGVFSISDGEGICGHYNSTTTAGVCLWSGSEQENPTLESAGWLNGPPTVEREYISKGKVIPETVKYAPVLDGCCFDTKSLAEGCFDIAVTIKLFNEFNPTQKEIESGMLEGGLIWDFDSLYGKSLQQAPV